MVKFLAMRVKNGYLTLDDIKEPLQSQVREILGQ